ncbi:MAG: hypothetical protein ACRYGF_15825 [Janthinobacterium lividum]
MHTALLGNDPFESLQIPDALQEGLQRHREHLARLITSLKAVGLSEEQIEESVSVIVTSYKEELLRAVKAMMR